MKYKDEIEKLKKFEQDASSLVSENQNAYKQKLQEQEAKTEELKGESIRLKAGK